MGGGGRVVLAGHRGHEPGSLSRRILGIAMIGTSVLVFLLIYATHHWIHFPLREYDGLMAIVAAPGLLVVASWELRQLISARAER